LVWSPRRCFFWQVRYTRSFSTDALVDLLAVHRDILRRIDPDTHLIAFEAEYGDRDVVSDPQRFALSSSQYQHESPKVLLLQLFYTCSGMHDPQVGSPGCRNRFS
jgi:hypothetical protein